jgi:hypothetical protein
VVLDVPNTNRRWLRRLCPRKLHERGREWAIFGLTKPTTRNSWLIDGRLLEVWETLSSERSKRDQSNQEEKRRRRKRRVDDEHSTHEHHVIWKNK